MEKAIEKAKTLALKKYCDAQAAKWTLSDKIAVATGLSISLPAAVPMMACATTTAYSMFSKFNDSVLGSIVSGLCLIIASVAVIMLLKEIIATFLGDQRERSSRIGTCIVVLVICVFAGFAPSLMQWLISLGGSTDISSDYATKNSSQSSS